LKAFSKIKRSLKVPLVLTPHAGEYAILTDEILPENLEARINVIQKTAKKFNATILSKGQIDIICNQEKVKLSTTGNQGMTVGGTGDVLVGIVSGLITLGADPFEAAVAGAFINGAAGDFVASEIGFHIVASDIIGYIPIVMQNPMNHLKVKNLSAT
jgi:NAD(P)H-hydrate epimerase